MDTKSCDCCGKVLTASFGESKHLSVIDFSTPGDTQHFCNKRCLLRAFYFGVSPEDGSIEPKNPKRRWRWWPFNRVKGN